VIDRLVRFYTHENSNIHRADHELAARATDAYEDARATVASFLGAPAGDEIVISCLEHHANIVPWQLLASERGAVLRVIPVDDSGQIVFDEYRKLLTDRTRLVAVSHAGNAP